MLFLSKPEGNFKERNKYMKKYYLETYMRRNIFLKCNWGRCYMVHYSGFPRGDN